MRQNMEFTRENRDIYLELINRARYVGVALSVLGGWIAYRWSTALFGGMSGVIALCLWVFGPEVLCWAGVCTVDMGAAVFGMVAVYSLRCHLRKPGWLKAGLAGCTLGLAMLSKFTWLILYPAYLLFWIVFCLSNRDKGNRWRINHWLQFVLVLGMSVFVINAGYLFLGSGKPLGAITFRSHALTGLPDGVPGNRLRGTWVESVPLPLPETFVLGVDKQKSLAESGLPAYLCGEWKQDGWWYYYVYALAVKLPLGTLALALLAVVLFLGNGCFRGHLIEELLLWVPAGAVLMLFSLHTGINEHMRYVLPMLPFVFVSVSRVGLLLTSRFKSAMCHRSLPQLLGAGFIIAGLGWNVVSTCRIHPHYLSYFNELAGGPENGWRHLINSNIDWGQDLLFLKRWVESHPEARPLKLAYFGGIDPHMVGLNCSLPQFGTSQILNLPPARPGVPAETGPQPGWYAVSVNFACGMGFPVYGENSQMVYIAYGAYLYFKEFTPVDRVGYSIWIYHILPEEADRVRARLGLPALSPLELPRK
jgi:hypothetical protein